MKLAREKVRRVRKDGSDEEGFWMRMLAIRTRLSKVAGVKKSTERKECD
jgi:hypothetical protein